MYFWGLNFKKDLAANASVFDNTNGCNKRVGHEPACLPAGTRIYLESLNRCGISIVFNFTN